MKTNEGKLIYQNGQQSHKHSPIKSSFSIIYLTIILVIFLVSSQDFTTAMFLTSESGPIQIFTVTGYFLVCLTAIYMQAKGEISFGNGITVICLVMALRELDFHDRFTTSGITKSRFYLSANVPWIEKFIGAAVLLSLTAFLLWFSAKHYRDFLRSIKKKHQPSFLVLNGIIFILISKTLDSYPSIYACIVEETIECAIPWFFFTSLLLHRHLVFPNKQ